MNPFAQRQNANPHAHQTQTPRHARRTERQNPSDVRSTLIGSEVPETDSAGQRAWPTAPPAPLPSPPSPPPRPPTPAKEASDLVLSEQPLLLLKGLGSSLYLTLLPVSASRLGSLPEGAAWVSPGLARV